MRRFILPITGLLLVTALGTMPVPAGATSTWTGYETAAAEDLQPQALLIDKYGRATAVLCGRNPESVGTYDQEHLYVARRTAGGVWTQARQVAVGVRCRFAVADASSEGDVTIAFTGTDASGPGMFAAVLVPGHGWSVRRLSQAGVKVEYPRVDVNRPGRAIVGWSTFNPDWSFRRAITATHLRGSWQRGVAHGERRLGAVAIDDAGRMAVLLEGDAIQVRRKAPRGAWGAFKSASGPGLMAQMSMVAGDITMVWQAAAGKDYHGDPTHALFSRRQRPNGTLTRRVQLTPSSDDIRSFDMAVDLRNRVAVLWAVGDTRVRFRRLDGSWGSVRVVTEAVARSGGAGQIEVDADGVWHLLVENSADYRLEHYSRVPGRGWSAPKVLHDQAHRPSLQWRLGVNDAGLVGVGWDSYSDLVYARFRSP